MTLKYEKFNKAEQSNLTNVEGKSLVKLMEESIQHVEENLNEAMKIINEEKISEISIKNRHIKSYKL